MHNPKDSYLQAIYQIIHYLKGTFDKGLLFKQGMELCIEAYMDLDYVRSVLDRRSTLGCGTFLRGKLVTWCQSSKVKCQSRVPSNGSGNCEFLWIKIILNDLKIK